MGLGSNIGHGLFVGWLSISISFVGFRASTRPTCQPFLCYQRNPTKWTKIESSPNNECRIKEFFLFYLLKKSKAKRHPQFVNRQSSFREVSHERRLWPRASSPIKKETFGTRFGNRPLLGFAFRYNNGKM
jgi:hypothetical protein